MAGLRSTLWTSWTGPLRARLCTGRFVLSTSRIRLAELIPSKAAALSTPSLFMTMRSSWNCLVLVRGLLWAPTTGWSSAAVSSIDLYMRLVCRSIAQAVLCGARSIPFVL